MAEARENNILNLTAIRLIASADLNYTFERGSEKKNDEKWIEIWQAIANLTFDPWEPGLGL